MLFHEIYGVYYAAVAKILNFAADGNVMIDERRIVEICNHAAFPVISKEITDAIRNDEWPIISKEDSSGFKTDIKRMLPFPLTILEKRWIKAILKDPRIRLFDIGEISGLDDIDPLFTVDDYRLFDKCNDGDDYTDDNYIKNFRLVIKAIRGKTALDIDMQNRYGRTANMQILPSKLEYSEKDDKFRILGTDLNTGKRAFININRIKECRLLDACSGISVPETEYREAILELNDINNLLERALMDFSSFERKVEKINDTCFKLHVYYDPLDETEIVIRILSFGLYMKAVHPESLVTEIKNRLIKQTAVGDFSV